MGGEIQMRTNRSKVKDTFDRLVQIDCSKDEQWIADEASEMLLEMAELADKKEFECTMMAGRIAELNSEIGRLISCIDVAIHQLDAFGYERGLDPTIDNLSQAIEKYQQISEYIK